MSTSSIRPQLVRFGNFEVDLTSCELRSNGKIFDLQGQPFQILKVMLERPGQLISREELKRQLWDGETFVDFDHSLNRAVNRLREALQDSAENPHFIQTLPRRGYRFIAPVERAVDGPINAGDIHKESSESAGSDWHRVGKVFAIALAASILTVTVSLAVRKLLLLSVPARPFIRSLAVLPLENLSSDPGQEYFTDGLTDELITELGEIHSLRVISRSSSMAYKRVHKPAREIARELNVDAIVGGTVLRSGSRVRITVQLVDAPADKHLWAKSYTGEVQDVLRLQEDVAHDVANQVSQLGEKVRPANTNPPAVSPRAHEAYFLGRYYWEKRGAVGNTPAAIRYFQRAIDDAPRFAAAYAALAETYAIVPDYSSARPGDSYEKAEAAANKALDLDPYSAQAHTTLALVAANKDFDWQRSESEFQRALDLNPSYSNAHHWHAFNLVFAGKFTDAIAEINEARDLDPLSTIVNANVGFFFYFAGMQERAIQIETKCLEVDPNNPEVHRYLGLALLQKHDYRGAIRHLRIAVDLSNNYPEYAGELSYAYALAGDRGQATHLLRDMERRARHEYISSFSLAVAYAGLGRRVAALNALQRAIDERSDMIPTLKVNPLFTMLHEDRRFAELLRRINLAG